MVDVSIVIPAFNERENLKRSISRVAVNFFEISGEIE